MIDVDLWNRCALCDFAFDKYEEDRCPRCNALYSSEGRKVPVAIVKR